MSKNEFSSLADLLQSQLKKISGNGLAYTMELQKQWPQIVGQAISQHSSVLYIKGTTLYVGVESSTWMSELSLIKNQIMFSIQKYHAEIKINDIKLN